MLKDGFACWHTAQVPEVLKFTVVSGSRISHNKTQVQVCDHLWRRTFVSLINRWQGWNRYNMWRAKKKYYEAIYWIILWSETWDMVQNSLPSVSFQLLKGEKRPIYIYKALVNWGSGIITSKGPIQCKHTVKGEFQRAISFPRTLSCRLCYLRCKGGTEYHNKETTIRSWTASR